MDKNTLLDNSEVIAAHVLCEIIPWKVADERRWTSADRNAFRNESVHQNESPSLC